MVLLINGILLSERHDEMKNAQDSSLYSHVVQTSNKGQRMTILNLIYEQYIFPYSINRVNSFLNPSAVNQNFFRFF